MHLRQRGIAFRLFVDKTPREAEVRSSVWRRDDPLPLAFCCGEWFRKGVKTVALGLGASGLAL